MFRALTISCVFSLLFSVVLLAEPASAQEPPADSLGIYATFCKAADPGTDPTEAFEKLFKVGRYDRALALVSSANVATDSAAFAKTLLCLLKLNRYMAVVRLAERRLVLDNSNSTIGCLQELIGTCYLRLGENEKALQALNRAVEVAPTETAYTSRAMAYQELGRNDLVDDDLNRASPRVPNADPFGVPLPLRALPHTRFDYLNLFESMKTLGGAPVEVPLSAASTDSKIWHCSTQAAQFENSGDFEKAASMYRKSLDLSDKDASLWNALGLCLLTSQYKSTKQKQDLNEVVSCFKKACSLASEDWRFRYNLAIAEYGNDNSEEAARIAESLIKSDKVPAPYRTNLSVLRILSSSSTNLLELIQQRIKK